jgi:hypothetical protein
MKNGESRRIIPESIAAWTVVSSLFLFELSVLFGGLEIKGAAMARIAPWAYSLYSRLVGEHPDQISTRMEWDFFDEEEALEAVTTDADSGPIFLLSPDEDSSAAETNAFEWPDLYDDEIEVIWPELTPTNRAQEEAVPVEEPPGEEAQIKESPVEELPEREEIPVG